jgi:hypothetical protein
MSCGCHRAGDTLRSPAGARLASVGRGELRVPGSPSQLGWLGVGHGGGGITSRSRHGVVEGGTAASTDRSRRTERPTPRKAPNRRASGMLGALARAGRCMRPVNARQRANGPTKSPEPCSSPCLPRFMSGCACQQGIGTGADPVVWGTPPRAIAEGHRGRRGGVDLVRQPAGHATLSKAGPAAPGGRPARRGGRDDPASGQWCRRCCGCRPAGPHHGVAAVVRAVVPAHEVGPAMTARAHGPDRILTECCRTIASPRSERVALNTWPARGTYKLPRRS